MNALLLAGACAGALAASLFSTPTPGAPESRSASADRGSMTRDVQIDPKTGEMEETSVIAFLD